MHFYVHCLKHQLCEGDGIVYVKIFAREDVDVDHAVSGPSMQAHVACGNNHEARKAIVKGIARFISRSSIGLTFSMPIRAGYSSSTCRNNASFARSLALHP